jgi:two-component system torCAD operon response regulator TorR
MPSHERKSHILVVEDELLMRELLVSYLKIEEYLVSEADSAAILKKVLVEKPIDLILLDINLPDQDGFSVVREIRSRSDIGIILVSKRNDGIDKIIGLEMGADDYICKPFEPRELIARVKSVLRRTQAKAANDLSPCVRFLNWTFHLGKRCVIDDKGEEVYLSGAEFKLLKVLIQKPNVVIERKQLQMLVDPQLKSTSRSIDVLITRLRSKLRDKTVNSQIIVTVHGIGYVFAAEVY